MAGLPLAGQRVWAADAAQVTAEKKSAAPRLEPVSESVHYPPETGLPRSALYAHARAKALLTALHKAAAALPQRREIHMARLDPKGLLALTAQLYTASAESLDSDSPAANDDTAHTAPLHLALELTPVDHTETALLQALQHPQLLFLRQDLLEAMEKEVAGMDSHWPSDPAVTETSRKKTGMRFYWPQERWQEAARRLRGLWLALHALELRPEGWLTRADALEELDKAGKDYPSCAPVLLLLAEAQLQNNLPQRSVEYCTAVVELARAMPERARSSYTGRARYIRALAHWRLQQLALAEEDLSVALHHTAQDLQQREKARRFRARGAVRLLRQNYAGSCEDFSAACALGDCEGLAMMRAQGYCPAHSVDGGAPAAAAPDAPASPPKDAGPQPAAPAKEPSLPPSFLDPAPEGTAMTPHPPQCTPDNTEDTTAKGPDKTRAEQTQDQNQGQKQD